jgi:hypothetical protein
MRHGVLSEKRGLEPNFCPDPLAFRMRLIGSMVATATTAELGSEVSRLNLFEVIQLAPCLVANCTGDIDLEFQDGHNSKFQGFTSSKVFKNFEL